MAQEFADEIQQAEKAEAEERERADKLEAEVAQAERELSELSASSIELDSLEERYWHDFNDFQIQLRAHIDERDVLLNKVHHAFASFFGYCKGVQAVEQLTKHHCWTISRQQGCIGLQHVMYTYQ